MIIGVIGAGTFGMSLARLLANKGYEVTVWSATESKIDEYIKTRRHKNLPNMVIPDSIIFTKNIADTCVGKDMIVFAVPSVYVRETARKTAAFIPENCIIVDVAKGIEADSLMSMSQVIESEMIVPVRMVALSGPTHAEEVSIDLPSTIVSASHDEEAARIVQETFMTPVFRVYTNTDMQGVELCGAMKNIIALAAGMCDGIGYGDNTKAALITRGLAEITRLGMAMGCDIKTFQGLAGIGDLVVTCTSKHSRNNRCGYLIGQGLSIDEAVKQIGMVVEGINAIPAAKKLAEKYNVEMPIVSAAYRLVNEGLDPRQVTAALMEREMKNETL